MHMPQFKTTRNIDKKPFLPHLNPGRRRNPQICGNFFPLSSLFSCVFNAAGEARVATLFLALRKLLGRPPSDISCWRTTSGPFPGGELHSAARPFLVSGEQPLAAPRLAALVGNKCWPPPASSPGGKFPPAALGLLPTSSSQPPSSFRCC